MASVTGWSVQTVDSNGSVGQYTSLAFDALGNPAMSYYDDSNQDLKYAYYNGSYWDIETVDSQGDVGQYTSLAFDNSGNPSISYYDNSYDDLKYAHFNGVSWDIETVDSADSVGQYSSLAFDTLGNPAISYFDSSNYDLKYTCWNDSSWDIETVDGLYNVGKHTSLAFDNYGNPAISYYDWSHYYLKYAYWNESSWDVEIVDNAGYDGQSTSLIFNTSGNPSISYNDGANEDLKYAFFNGSSWDIETVDSEGNVGQASSLAFDTSGNPAISYYDYSNLHLKYAHWNGSSWDVETLDSNSYYAGQYTSLAFDNYGNPAIGYYYYGGSELKYAYTFAISGTDVSGVISEDSTWNLAESPYLATGNVVVESGATLTIEPGVEVRFGDDYGLIVDGALDAQGTVDNNITFTSCQPFPSPGNWGGIRFRDSSVDSDCIIKYAQIKYGTTGIKIESASPSISYCTITDNSSWGIDSSGNSPIADNTISDNGSSGYMSYSGGGINCSSGSLSITNNTIYGNTGSGINCSSGYVLIDGNTVESNSGTGIYVSSSYGTTLKNNTVRLNNQGIDISSYGSGLISNNLVSENISHGVRIGSASATISCNTITGNGGYGLYRSGSGQPEVKFNNICNNTTYEFYNDDASDIAATSNWWGTAETTAIKSLIYDYYDDYNKGKVTYSPFLESEWNGLPTILTVTPSPFTVEYSESITLTATLTDSNGDPLSGRSITWSSGYMGGYVNPTAGTTDTQGKVTTSFSYSGTWTGTITAIFNGDASYQASVGESSGAVTLKSTTISIDPSSFTIESGESIELTAVLENSDSNALSGYIITWEAGAGSLSISSGTTGYNGKLTATYTAPEVTEQTPVTITASFAGDSTYQESSVTSSGTVTLKLTTVTIDPASFTIEAGGSTTLAAILEDSDGNALSGKTITWEAGAGSLSTSSGTTNNNGRITVTYTAPAVIEQASITITASFAGDSTYQESSDSCTASPPPLDAEFSAGSRDILEGDTVSFTNTTSGGVSPFTYEWDFNNDGIVDSTEKEPTYIYTVAGAYTVTLKVNDSAPNTDVETKTDYIVVSRVILQQTVTADGGTLVTEGGQVVMEFPQGAVDIDTEITVIEKPVAGAPPPPSGFNLCNSCFVIEGVETLGREITITIAYCEGDLAIAGGNPKYLRVSRWDEDRQEWIMLPATLDRVSGTLTVTTDRLSQWAVLAKVLPTTYYGLTVVGWVVVGGFILFIIMAAVIERQLTVGLRREKQLSMWEKEGYDLSDYR